jgi:alginate O-acetyltransferase complex protein AlgI
VLFPTVTFTVFFLVVLPLSWLLMQHPTRWRPFILVASYVFYGWWDWRFCVLLAASTLAHQVLGVAIHRAREPARRKALLVLAVAVNLCVLGFFKYYDFFVTSLQNRLADAGVDVSGAVLEVTLPIGISFFTFQALSYVVDIYRGDFRPVSLGKFAVYLSFFPHLVAGPIVRAREFIPQLARPRDPRRVDVGLAAFLIVGGLFKKVVIANFLADAIVDDVFGAPNQYSSFEVLVAVYAYAVQIYCDFSGYTDIAIGLALLLGFRFPQNFDAPYSAESLQDFWRRWHMTLSRWLRDYVYIPLGGSRGSRLLTYRNLMLTMLLGGLWHGAAWTFVVWGGIHGVGLAVERWLGERRVARGLPEPPSTWLRRNARRLVTFNIVCAAWIFFRADSFATAADIFRRLFDAWGEPSSAVTLGVVVAILVGIGTQYLPARVPLTLMARFSHLPPVAQGALVGVALMLISTLGPAGVAPFIYFQF